MKNKTNLGGLMACNSLIQLAFKSFLLIVLITMVSLSAQGQVFSTPENLSNISSPGSTASGNFRFQVDDKGNIYVVWAAQAPLYYDIFFSKSTDGGKNFSNPVNITEGDLQGSSPEIAVDGQGNIYVIWSRLYFSYSIDGGESFTEPKQISDIHGPIGYDIAVDCQGNINVIWRGGISPYTSTFFCRSIDGGENFSSPIVLTTQPSGISYFEVDCQGNIYVVLCQFSSGAYFTCSSDGETFTPLVNLNTDPEFGAGAPRIGVDSKGNINVVWQKWSHKSTSVALDIFFTRSTNGGETFSPPINISNSPYQSSSVEIVVDNQDNVNLVWWEGIDEVYFSRSTNGVDFSVPVNVSNTPSPSADRTMAVDTQGNINITWSEEIDHDYNVWAIFFSRSIDEGLNFSEPKNLSMGRHSRIATDNKENIYIVYHPAPDIFFMRSIDSLFEDLIDLIEEINLNNGISNSLDAKLGVALRALEDANENNNTAAIQALESFIIQVEQQRGGQITNEDADALLTAVQNILDLLY